MVGDKYAPSPLCIYLYVSLNIWELKFRAVKGQFFQTFETYKFQSGQLVCASLYEHIKLQNVTVVREVWGEHFSKKEKGYY